MRKTTSQITLYLGLLILLCAFILRIYGIISHEVPDESYEMDRALDVLAGKFDLQRIGKGGLYILLTFVYFFGKVFSQGSDFYLFSGRVIQALIGAALIWFIFQNIRLLYGGKWALLFVIPTVFNIQLIYNAQYINVQNLMFLGVMIHLYLIVKYVKEEENRFLGWSFVVLAAASACQISALIVTVPLFIFLLIRFINSSPYNKKMLMKVVLKFGLISTILFILMNPGVVIYFKSTSKSLLSYMALSKIENITSGDETSYGINLAINFWSEYGRYILNFFGTVNLILLILSSLMAVIKRKWMLLYPLSIFAAFYLVFVNASSSVYSGRYIIPGLLMGFVLLSFSAIELHKMLIRRKGKLSHIASVALIIFICMSFAKNAAYSMEYVRQVTLLDTRDITTAWLKENTREGDKILLEKNVNFPKAPNCINAIYIANRNAYPSLKSITATHIVINKSLFNFLSSKRSQTSYQDFYNELKNSGDWEIVHLEKPRTGKTSGPELLVYKRKSDG